MKKSVYFAILCFLVAPLVAYADNSPQLIFGAKSSGSPRASIQHLDQELILPVNEIAVVRMTFKDINNSEKLISSIGLIEEGSNNLVSLTRCSGSIKSNCYVERSAVYKPKYDRKGKVKSGLPTYTYSASDIWVLLSSKIPAAYWLSVSALGQREPTVIVTEVTFK